MYTRILAILLFFLKIRNIISKNRKSKVTYFTACIFCGILKARSHL